MPELDGIEATRRLRRRPGVEARVLVLTTFDLDEYVYAAVRAGASGFLLKDAPREQLVDRGPDRRRAARRCSAPAVTRRLIERFVPRPAPSEAAPALAELSARELEVLRLLARGLSNAEIAAELIVGEATVKTPRRARPAQARRARPRAGGDRRLRRRAGAAALARARLRVRTTMRAWSASTSPSSAPARPGR